jgi:hypothetical protein
VETADLTKYPTEAKDKPPNFGRLYGYWTDDELEQAQEQMSYILINSKITPSGKIGKNTSLKSHCAMTMIPALSTIATISASFTIATLPLS